MLYGRENRRGREGDLFAYVGVVSRYLGVGVGGGVGGPTGGGASTLSSTILRKTASESNLLKMKMKPKRIGALGESTRAGPYQVGGVKNHVHK